MKLNIHWVALGSLLCWLTVAPVQAQTAETAGQVDAAAVEGDTQAPPPPATSGTVPTVRQIVESEAETEALAEVAEARLRDKGPLRETPRASMLTLSVIMERGDFEQGAEWMDLRYLPPGISAADGPLLIEQLRYIFNRHIWIDAGALSDKPEGHRDDGLPAYRDSLGTIESSKGEVELLLQRVDDGKGGLEWKISNATVAQVPALWQEFGRSEFATRLAAWLPPWNWLGIDNWQWAYLLLFNLCVAGGVYLLAGLLKGWAQRSDAVWVTVAQNFLTGPLSVFVYLMLLRGFMLSLGLSVIARTLFESSILLYLAYIFLVLGLVNFFANQARRNMDRAGRPEGKAIVRPIAAFIKIVLVVVIVIMGLGNSGYDVTTIIAGLGVGSVAVALAAQKTLENLIGAITLYIARPVQLGNFCRFGDVTGTVEEIGLRSTLLRTQDRTLLNIPNAVFAAGAVENFSARDSMRFYRLLGLRLGSTPDQLRFVLARLRELLYAHPAIITSSVSVRLSTINDYAYMVRLDSRVNCNDFQQYLAVAEDINLRIIDLIHDSGTNFAYPSQTVMVEQAEPMDADRKNQVESLVEQWRRQDELPFPQWSDEYVQKIENTLEFPPDGSSFKLRNTDLGGRR